MSLYLKNENKTRTVKSGAVFSCPSGLQLYKQGLSQPTGIFCGHTYTWVMLVWLGLGWDWQKREISSKLARAEGRRGWTKPSYSGESWPACVLDSLHPWPLSKVSCEGRKAKTPGKRNRRSVERKKRRLRSPVDLTPVELTGLPSPLSSTQKESFATLTSPGFLASRT